MKPINGWTKDEIIQVIRNRPNWQSSLNGHCRYRDERGGRCAVGAFIPDDKYEYRFEGKCAEAVLFILSPGLRVHMPFDVKDMDVFQQVHDRAASDATDINQRLEAWVEENVEDVAR